MVTTILDHVGPTPIIPLGKLEDRCEANLFAKLELMNPSGSVKDRIGKYIVEKAERTGKLKPDSIIVEVTSGNTGISFAMVAAARGYAIKILMPENMTQERVTIMRALGAEVILTPADEGFLGALATSRKLADEDPRVFLPRQFENRDNIEAHKFFTGAEIVRQMGNEVNAFVAGIGTGGTIMGVAEMFEEAGVCAHIVAVEPAEAAVLSGKQPGRHKIQGLGDGFVPNLVDRSKIDDVIEVASDDAIAMAQRLTQALGLLVGISSGANALGAIEMGRRLGPGANVLTVLPDRGDRYFSTELYGGEAFIKKLYC